MQMDVELDDPSLTAFIEAVERNDTTLALSIIEKDPAIVTKFTRGYGKEADEYAIHYAAQLQSSVVLKELIRLGADPSVQDQETKTPLHHAISEGSLECVRAILAAGGRDNDSSSILYSIVWTEEQAPLILQALSDVGVDVNTLMPPYLDEFGPTVLFQAIYYLSENGVRTLLACGADPSIKDEEGRNALQYAEHVSISKLKPMFGVEQDAAIMASIKTMLTNKLSSLFGK